jgi:hypothetical protein
MAHLSQQGSAYGRGSLLEDPTMGGRRRKNELIRTVLIDINMLNLSILRPNHYSLCSIEVVASQSFHILSGLLSCGVHKDNGAMPNQTILLTRSMICTPASTNVLGRLL